MALRADITSQRFFRDPAAEIARLRAFDREAACRRAVRRVNG